MGVVLVNEPYFSLKST